jgi:hypothetical protein
VSSAYDNVKTDGPNVSIQKVIEKKVAPETDQPLWQSVMLKITDREDNVTNTRERKRGKGATDTCVHHKKVKMPRCLTMTYSFLKSEMKARRRRRHMKKECSIWHLNFMRQLEAGSML